MTKRNKFQNMNNNFRTPINISGLSIDINHHDQIMSVGSCFAVEIAQYLTKHKFKTLTNPHGITYNPLSVARVMSDIVQQRLYQLADLVKHQGLFHSFQHHGDFSASDPDDTLTKINNQIVKAHHFLKKSKWIIITLGTAHVFYHLKRKEVVNNCHRFPATLFRRDLLSVHQVTKALKKTLEMLSNFNPSCHILFTISPVRHWRDGPVENNDSKATLRLAIRPLIKKINNTHYFPSYEIIMDELRDYRFYGNDMLHPNSLAVQYIWQKFEHFSMNQQTQMTNHKIGKLIEGIGHKPFRVTSPEHQKFLKQWKAKIISIQLEYPHINFEEELTKVQNQII